MTRTATLEDVLDARRIGGFQIFVVVLCGLVVLLDGINTQLIGYAAPAISKSLHLGHGRIAAAFGSGLFGLMIGGLSCSVLADVLGRKALLVASTLAFGVFTVASGFSQDLSQLVAWRFLAGLGLGGAMPIAITLTAEVSPRRAEAWMVIAMFCGFPLGGALAGVLANAILPEYGWRAVFYVGGAMALVLTPILALLMPESIAFLVHRNAPAARISAALRRLAPDAGDVTLVAAIRHAKRSIPVTALFQDGRALCTLLMWVVYFMSLLDIYFLASWLPTVLNSGGKSLKLAVLGASLLQFGGVAGTLVIGRVLDRTKPYRMLVGAYVGAALFIAAIGMASQGAMLLGVLFGAGFFLVGGQSGLNYLATSFYPTSARASGIGWGLGIGRIGSIIGPTAGAVLIATRWPVNALFLVVAAPCAVAALAVLVMAFAARRQPPQDIPIVAPLLAE